MYTIWPFLEKLPTLELYDLWFDGQNIIHLITDEYPNLGIHIDRLATYTPVYNYLTSHKTLNILYRNA